MANNGNGGPGKTRHLNDIAARYGNRGMHVICVHPTENDLCSSDSVLCAPALDGKAGFFSVYCSTVGTVCSWENRVKV